VSVIIQHGPGTTKLVQKLMQLKTCTFAVRGAPTPFQLRCSRFDLGLRHCSTDTKLDQQVLCSIAFYYVQVYTHVHSILPASFNKYIDLTLLHISKLGCYRLTVDTKICVMVYRSTSLMYSLHVTALYMTLMAISPNRPLFSIHED
jgi:hypothetical protein